MDAEELSRRIALAPAHQSISNRLRKAGFSPLEINLLREAHGKDLPVDPAALARAIKGAPITLTGFVRYQLGDGIEKPVEEA